MTSSIVTGASRGLGLGIARRLVAAGHDVVAVARVAPEIPGARNLAADVTSADDVARIVEAAEGGIALLVNNAAAPPVMDSLEDLTVERFRLGFEVDVAGTLAVTKAAAPQLAGGTVVNLIAAARTSEGLEVHAAARRRARRTCRSHPRRPRSRRSRAAWRRSSRPPTWPSTRSCRRSPRRAGPA